MSDSRSSQSVARCIRAPRCSLGLVAARAIAVWVSIALAGCAPGVGDGAPQDGDNGGSAIGDGDLPPPTELVVERFVVPAGTSEPIASNTTITSRGPIEIAGDVVIDDGDGGDVTFVAEEGDIIIDGRVLAATASDEAAKAVAAKIVRTNLQPVSANPRKGASFVFIARGAGGNVDIRRFSVFQSGRGQDAIDETIVIPPANRYQASSGSDGGDLVFRAPNGAIILPTNQAVTDPPMFGLGDGGSGADLFIHPSQFQTDLTDLELIGGDGGASGKLEFDAPTVRNAPAPSMIRWFDGGHGGDGGRVLGDVTVNGFLDLNAPAATGDWNLQLREIVVQGARGGDGAVAGGDGGLGLFFCGDTLHRRGDPATAVRAYGGDGGDVFASPMPGVEVRGGNGGSYAALGCAGYSGEVPPGLSRDGEDGGDATGQGGKGGDILAGVQAVDIRAGAGGHVPGVVETIVAGIPFGPTFASRTPAELVPSGVFGVSAGGGGSAAPDCAGCPGGDAGDRGAAYAYGGAGGSVFASQGVGGMGGDTWRVAAEVGVFSEGGDGNPPGKGGCPGTAVAEAGQGGNGPTLGPDGTRNLEPITGDCAPDGEVCGADLECEAEPPIDPIECTDEAPESYTLSVRTDYVDDELGRDAEVTSTNTYGCSGGMCGYTVFTTFEDVVYDDQGQLVTDPDGNIVFEERTVESLRTFFDAPQDAYPHCTPQGVRVSAAAGPVVVPFVYQGQVLSTTTITCGGCECLDTMAGIPADWSCCLITCPPPSEGACPSFNSTARQAEDSTLENPRFYELRPPGDCP